MDVIKKLTINGKEYEGEYSLLLLYYAAKYGVKIELPTQSDIKKNPHAWLPPYIDMIYVGILARAEELGKEIDLTRHDVLIWATHNRVAFECMVVEIASLFSSGKPISENEDVELDEEDNTGGDKKKVSSIGTKSKVSWWVSVGIRVKRLFG